MPLLNIFIQIFHRNKTKSPRLKFDPTRATFLSISSIRQNSLQNVSLSILLWIFYTTDSQSRRLWTNLTLLSHNLGEISADPRGQSRSDGGGSCLENENLLFVRIGVDRESTGAHFTQWNILYTFKLDCLIRIYSIN